MTTALMTRLVIPFVLKASAAGEERTFEGLAATWDQDLGQDIIHKGAFKASLKNWKASGEAMPLLNSHNHFDIFSALGQMLEAKETPEGLWTKWEVIDGEDGDRALARLRPSTRTKKPLVGKMSIGFIPTKFSFEQPEGTDGWMDRIRHIQEADLKEVSLVLFPMNPNASIDATSVKMMIQSAQATDPTKIDPLTRLELRRLASRIGTLLRKPAGTKEQPPVEESEEELEEEVPEVPATPPATPPNPETPPAEEEPTGSETPEEIEEEPTSEQTPESTEPKMYQFQEALQHRLKSALLRNTVSTSKSA